MHFLIEFKSSIMREQHANYDPRIAELAVNPSVEIKRQLNEIEEDLADPLAETAEEHFTKHKTKNSLFVSVTGDVETARIYGKDDDGPWANILIALKPNKGDFLRIRSIEDGESNISKDNLEWSKDHDESIAVQIRKPEGYFKLKGSKIPTMDDYVPLRSKEEAGRLKTLYNAYNRPYRNGDDSFEFGGVVTARRNHGVLHGMRHGDAAGQAFLAIRNTDTSLGRWAQRITEKDPVFRERLEFTSSYARVGRESEMGGGHPPKEPKRASGDTEEQYQVKLQKYHRDLDSFKEQRAEYDQYLSDSAKIFRENAINDPLFKYDFSTKPKRSLTPEEQDDLINFYAHALYNPSGYVPAGGPYKTTHAEKAHRFISAAHELELRREVDYNRKRIQKSISESLFGKEDCCNTNQKEIVASLWHRQGEYLDAHGDWNMNSISHGGEHARGYTDTFYRQSHNLIQARDNLDQVNLRPLIRVHPYTQVPPDALKKVSTKKDLVGPDGPELGSRVLVKIGKRYASGKVTESADGAAVIRIKDLRYEVPFDAVYIPRVEN
ncbi:MAG: hypothetical protein HRU09_12195 [Oligoflexales bacterium]|nr:hypothetical protein [Oligoflexales bacterium]